MQEYTRRIHIRLTETQFEEMRTIADLYFDSISDLGRAAICQYLELRDNYISQQGKRNDLRKEGP